MHWEISSYPNVMACGHAVRWLDYRDGLGAPLNTLGAYSTDLDDFLSWLASEAIEATQVTREDVARFAGARRRTARPSRNRSATRSTSGLSDVTIARRLSTVRQWYDFLQCDQIVARNPVPRGSRGGRGERPRRGPTPTVKKTPWIPNEHEWEAIVSAVAAEPLRNRIMFALCYECALRRTELCGVRLNDIDHALRQLMIRAETSKSRDDRALPFGEHISEMLIRYERMLPPLTSSNSTMFLSESTRNHGQPISYWTWNKFIERVRNRSGVSRFHGHTIRHLALTDLARAGWNVLELKDFAGHRRVETTDKYIHLAGKHLRDRYSKTVASLKHQRSSALARLACTAV